jgi:F-type H+-transporting ATPase subunit delta
MPGALAFRYARALANVVFEPGSSANPQGVVAEIASFEEAMAACADLKTALESPAVKPARKRAIVAHLAGMLPLSGLVRRFLFVLIDHRRLGLVRDMREAFEAVSDERMGIVRADVVSARPLGPVERQELLATLGHMTGKQALARFRVEDGLIGGLVARIGSTVYDGSIRGQLQGLRHSLAGGG